MKRSAGVLLYRGCVPVGANGGAASGDLELLIAHPGGPLFARKDFGCWTVPKGEYLPEEPALEAAIREFTEEIGHAPPAGEFLDLGEVRQASGKLVRIFAIAGDLDTARVVSNDFEMEWPPRSNISRAFPEIDKAEWVSPATARAKLNKSQAPFVDRLVEILDTRSGY